MRGGPESPSLGVGLASASGRRPDWITSSRKARCWPFMPLTTALKVAWLAAASSSRRALVSAYAGGPSDAARAFLQSLSAGPAKAVFEGEGFTVNAPAQ